MMRYLILFCALAIVTAPAHAAKNRETIIVGAMAQYCVPPVRDREDPAAYVLAQGLKELPSEQARKFSPEGGRVFEIPAASGNAVLIANNLYGYTCAIAVHKLKPASFWNALDTEMKGFSLMREKRVEGDRLTKKEYALESLSGTLTLLVTASDISRPNGLQALMTLALIKK